MKFYSDDYLWKNVRISENNQELLEISKHLKRTIIKKESVLKAERGKIYLRKDVVKMLKTAESFLPEGYSFIIYDGFRPEKTQNTYFNNHMRKLRKQHPEWSENKLRKEAAKFVADPESFCPHMTGGAFDISLAKNGRQINMGGFHLYEEDHIPSQIKENRLMLAKILRKAKFVNYHLEWWHWSYGDMYWCAQNKKKCTLYSQLRKESYKKLIRK